MKWRQTSNKYISVNNYKTAVKSVYLLNFVNYIAIDPNQRRIFQ